MPKLIFSDDQAIDMALSIIDQLPDKKFESFCAAIEKRKSVRAKNAPLSRQVVTHHFSGRPYLIENHGCDYPE